MSTQTITVPDGGTVLVITQGELDALKIVLQQLDSMRGVVLEAKHHMAIYQLAREISE